MRKKIVDFTVIFKALTAMCGSRQTLKIKTYLTAYHLLSFTFNTEFSIISRESL
jgi:hypothetical protein